MGKNKFWIFTSIVASVFCLVAGIWILAATGFDSRDEAVFTGIGFYFIGKAFFVGPLLYLTAVKKNNH